MFRLVIPMAVALLVVSTSGCLFSGRPCAPGDWHYHSCDCRCAACSGECRDCTGHLPSDDVDDTEFHGGLKPTLRVQPLPTSNDLDEPKGPADRPAIQPTPERIPPLPSSTTGAAGRSRPPRPRATQVAQLQGDEPNRPRTSADPAQKAVAADVQKCNWQQSDDTASQSTPATDPPQPEPRRQPITPAAPNAGNAKAAEPHLPPSANDVSVSKSPPVPYPWGYFGASGKW